MTDHSSSAVSSPDRQTPSDVDLSSLPRDLRRRAYIFLESLCDFDFKEYTTYELSERLAALQKEMSLSASNAISHQPEVFSVLSELAARFLGQRPYLVQHLAAWLMSQAYLAEMATGEGKTLASALVAAYLALSGRKVHVMTANAYLAERDATEMGVLYRAAGLSVGVSLDTLTVEEKSVAYSSDITYATAIQFAFDYLADHLVFEASSQAANVPRQWAIVDEADSLMLDEARTPLIISGVASPDDQPEQWASFAKILLPHHYETDEVSNLVWFTPSGITLAERHAQVSNLYEHPVLAARSQAALFAEVMLKKDRDYLVVGSGDQAFVAIIDESTGRVLPGRRWQDGIHEAVEAKESLPVRHPAPTLAQITVPAFLALYENVAATTATAKSSQDEFAHLYDIEVVEVPRHLPSRRLDEPDRMFLTMSDKLAAIVSATKSLLSASRPVLIGAPTVAEATSLSRALDEAGIEHSLLSARHHAKEAHIIENAGRPGAVTVATNMAGRGVDIKLGGFREGAHDQAAYQRVVSAGGLAVLSTARHSSKRIDLQLKGRCARQGDPGSTRGFLSCEDDLLSGVKESRLPATIARLAPVASLGAEAKLLDKLVDDIQARYEMSHASQRKHRHDLDAVYSAQRVEMYRYRDLIISRSWRDNLTAWYTLADDHSVLLDSNWPFIDDPVRSASTGEPLEFSSAQPADIASSETAPQKNLLEDDEVDPYVPPQASDLKGHIDSLLEEFLLRSTTVKDQQRSFAVAYVLASTLDASWQHQLSNLDALAAGIHLRGASSRSPEAMFSLEAYALFERMMFRMLAIGVNSIASLSLSPKTP